MYSDSPAEQRIRDASSSRTTNYKRIYKKTLFLRPGKVLNRDNSVISPFDDQHLGRTFSPRHSFDICIRRRTSRTRSTSHISVKCLRGRSDPARTLRVGSTWTRHPNAIVAVRVRRKASPPCSTLYQESHIHTSSARTQRSTSARHRVTSASSPRSSSKAEHLWFISAIVPHPRKLPGFRSGTLRHVSGSGTQGLKLKPRSHSTYDFIEQLSGIVHLNKKSFTNLST